MKNNNVAIGICIILVIVGFFGFIIIPNKIDDNFYKTSHETDPEYVRAFIYHNNEGYDVEIVKLSDILNYNGGWLACDNSDGTKNYYFNCKIVIYRVKE